MNCDDGFYNDADIEQNEAIRSGPKMPIGDDRRAVEFVDSKGNWRALGPQHVVLVDGYWYFDGWDREIGPEGSGGYPDGYRFTSDREGK